MSAQKLTWQEPDEDTVTTVEISRSATLYGTYTVVATIDATSDGLAKSSSNTWVVTYTDVDGLRTHWYKIRFYDGTNYSEYADATTSEELLRLCSVTEVKKVIDTVGRWNDDEVFDAITDVDNMIYIEFGTPLQASWSEVGKIDDTIQRRYYVGEEDIYRVDRVFYGTTTKTELYLDDAYKVNKPYGMIEVLPYASSGIELETTDDIEIHYVPNLFNKLAIYRTCKRLLEKADFTSGGAVSKELAVIKARLKEVETIVVNRFCLQKSSSVEYYDKAYGVNKKKTIQNHDRNLYIGSTGW